MKDKQHGGRIFEAARALGLNWHEVIDFSANINPIGQPKGLKEAIFKDFELSLHYPEAGAESFSARLAELTGLNHGNFLIGAGTTPQLYFLARSLGLTRPAIVGPAFAEYEAALVCAKLKAEYVLTRARDNWLVTQDTLNRLWRYKPDAVFIAQPANPTGRLVPSDLFLELAEECHKRQVWLIADEAFIDFTENGRTLLPLVRKNEKLIVLRSLTKIFAIPGLRLAYMAAHRQTIGSLKGLVEPWPLSSPALAAGFHCLALNNWKSQTHKALKIFRRHLLQTLTTLNIGRVFPTESNFLLMELGPEFDCDDLLDFLFQDGVLARDASNFAGLEKGHIRLAVRPLDEISVLALSLEKFKSQLY